MTVVVRTGTESDLAAVGAIYRRSRAAAYAGLVSPAALAAATGPATDAWWAERFRWERDTHALLVAELGGAVAGFGYTGPDELEALYVDPPAQRHGAGSALLAGSKADFLYVVDGNSGARRFYARHGWIPDGRYRMTRIGGEEVREIGYRKAL